MNAVKDDKGKYSILRILLVFIMILMVWMFWEWRTALHVELASDEPNYGDLIKLFLAMMVTFASALLAKILQKKFEK